MDSGFVRLLPFLSLSMCLCASCLTATGSLRAATGGSAPSAAAPAIPIKRVGVLTDNYPYCYLSSDGEIRGFAFELLHALEPHLAFKLEIVKGTTNEIHTAFQSGKLDINLTFASSAERKERFAFSKPYLPMEGTIILRKGTKGISGLEDLRGKRVFVHKGSVGATALIKAGLENSIVYVGSVEEALRLVHEGKGDATLASKITAMALARRADFKNLELVKTASPIYRTPYCIAVQLADADTLAQLDQALAIINTPDSNGDSPYSEIYRRHFGFIDPPGYSKLQIMVATSAGLAIALAVALWAWLQQRTLNRRIAKQAAALRKQEEQLRQTQKLEAIGTLANGIAHDFNNILTGIIANAELARMVAPKNSELTTSLSQILKSSDRARMLVRQIMTFSRKADRKPELLRIDPIISEVMQFLRSTTPPSIEFKRSGKENAGLVLADANQIHQVLMNLCTNAIHAMKGSPGVLELIEDSIEVHAEEMAPQLNLKPGRYLRVGIRDTGCGISPQVRQHLFEPFFTTKAPGEGTGLGLSVVHGIMQQHGGLVTVYSELGKGSLFQLYLPLASSQNEEPRSAHSAEIDAIPKGNGEMVLVLDDESAIVSVIERLLAKLGYQAAPFTDPEAALVSFKAAPNRFDFILTDLSMPHLSGIDFIRSVRSLKKDIPCILISGLLGEKEMREAREAGVQETIGKPVTQKTLAAVLAKCHYRAART